MVVSGIDSHSTQYDCPKCKPELFGTGVSYAIVHNQIKPVSSPQMTKAETACEKAWEKNQ